MEIYSNILLFYFITQIKLVILDAYRNFPNRPSIFPVAFDCNTNTVIDLSCFLHFLNSLESPHNKIMIIMNNNKYHREFVICILTR